MSTQIMRTLIAALCLTLGGAGCGQQNDKTGTPETKGPPPPARPEAPPPKAEAPPPRRPDSPQAEKRDRGDREHRGPRARWDDEQARRTPPLGPQTPYIGVVTTEVPPPLATHLGLGEGFGVLVEEIMPDSPAQKAGLQRYDIITMMNDQRLANAEQLSHLVRQQTKGDQLTLRVLRRGKEETFKVAVEERIMPPFERPGWNRFEPWTGDRFDRPWGDRFRDRRDDPPENLDEFFERMERFQDDLRKQQDVFQERMREFQDLFRRHMHDYQEKFREWKEEPQDRPAPEPPRSDDSASRRSRRSSNVSDRQSVSVSVQAGGDGTTRVVSQGVVEREDESGSYLFERRPGGEMFFTVRPRGGREQAWPVTTEEQRKAVPEQFRKKLDEMDDIRIDVRSNETPAPPPAPSGPKRGI